MKKHTLLYILYIGALLMLLPGLFSCSTTKRIADGEVLYTGLKKVSVYGPDSTKKSASEDLGDEIRSAVNVKANKITLSPSFRIPYTLWAYNINPEAKGLKGWIRRKFSQEPVLVSDVRPEVRTQMINEILDNNGYFQGHSEYVLNQGKNKKKASISYNVYTGPAYIIDSVELLPKKNAFYSLLDTLALRDSYLRKGSQYNTDSLSNARTRITNGLRNRGYYYFRPEYIEYLADSLITPQHISLRLTVASNTPAMAMTKYNTGKITFIARKHNGSGTPDTIDTSVATIVQYMPSRLRKNLIRDCILLREDRPIALWQLNNTQNRLSRMGIFKAIAVDINPDTTASKPTLDVTIDCTFDQPLEASIEVNASSKSNSYIGPGIKFGLTNKNIFGGGEQFSVALNGSYEWQTDKTGKHSSIFNSYEVGLTTTLAFPRLLAPKFIPRRHRNLNWTRITLNGDILNRPHFFKMAQLNASISYDWQATRHATSSFSPFKLTYTKLLNSTHEFDSITNANPAIALSFQSQYIPQMSYTYNYNRDIDSHNSINWTFTLQEAGNIFYSIYSLCGVKGKKDLFGTPFSQFVKGTTQVVYGRRLWGDNWIVSRAAVGAAHAYGNSSQVPYAEQFYVGGANSVRAFTVRSIGPGSYRPPKEAINGYFDQTGTFKFEFNVEYRFPIAGPLHGAVFFDSGNVWLLKKDPLRPGGELKGSSFFKDLATGTGAGLRLDISMIVIRADLGVGIHAPYNTGKSGYYNMTSFGKSLAFHLAIGYPF